MLETSVSSSLCGENLPFINLFDTKFSCFPPPPTRHQSLFETKPFISEKPVPLHSGKTWSGTYFLSFECIAEYLRSCEWHPAKEVKDDRKGGTFICSLEYDISSGSASFYENKYQIFSQIERAQTQRHFGGKNVTPSSFY